MRSLILLNFFTEKAMKWEGLAQVAVHFACFNEPSYVSMMKYAPKLSPAFKLQKL